MRALLGALLTLCAWATALRASAAVEGSAATAAAVMPAIGGVPWAERGIAALRADIDGLLDADAGLRGAHVGVLAIDTATGDVLYERRANEAFAPASTLKLVVGSAALDTLSPQFRFRTSMALGRDANVAEKSLVLQAGGDPTLRYDDLAAGVSALAARGGRSVSGTFVDDSAFDDVPYADGWTWDDFGQSYAPKISAATLDENVVHARVSPGSRVGDPAGIVYAGNAGPRPVRGCGDAPAERTLLLSKATTGPAGSEATIDVLPLLGGCPTVAGSVPLGSAPETLDIAVGDPLVFMANALQRSLPDAGIAAPSFGSGDAAIRPGPLVMDSPFWTHDSAPMRDLLGPRFWIPSDNLFAENLLKTLARVETRRAGSTRDGVAFERQWLSTIGIDPATATLADGSGLSQYDRITPRDLVAVLQHDWNGPNRQLVLDSLPIGGTRGTIEGIAGSAASGRVYAKTGSMMHVRGLAGYLATRRHGAVTFAFSVDDWLGRYPALAAVRARVLSRIVTD